MTETECTFPAPLQNRRGKLKIFFGYAAGTGKTYAMLRAGQEAKKRQADVVIGYLEGHDRPDTLAQARGLETVEPARIRYKGLELKEMDVDAILARHPDLVLADELAHTNARGSRHAKRNQDVREILSAGIDVYTTLNVQHLESLNDLVASITGIHVHERIPDDIFDLADQVELIDIEPHDLLVRLQEGKVYSRDQARLAQENFFTLENLNALRETALRRCADRMKNGKIHSRASDHILVCLSSSPSNARIIRSAARMAQAFACRFTALYVISPDTEDLPEAARIRLTENMRLANRLGADVQSVCSDDVGEAISDYARMADATKIIIGRSGAHSAFLSGKPLLEQLQQAVPEAEIFIVPDPEGSYDKDRPFFGQRGRAFCAGEAGRSIACTVLILTAAFGLCAILQRLGFSEANLLAVCIFAVLLCSVLVSSVWTAVLAALAASCGFGFLFAFPFHSVRFMDHGYILTFLLMTAASAVIQNLSERLRRSSHLSAQAAAQSSLLQEASQALLSAETTQEMMVLTAEQIAGFLHRNTVFYPNENGTLGKPCFSGAPEEFLGVREKAVALWTLKNNKRAGASTDTLSAAKGLYLAVRHQRNVLGVCGIELDRNRLTPGQNAIVLALLGQCALAMENMHIETDRRETEAAARQEKLRSGMLRSISHDLRTPLCTISASADVLLHQNCSEKQQKELERVIYEDACWLKKTVENLLSLTKLEDPSVQVPRELCDLEETAREAMKHLSSGKSCHPISLDCEGEPLVLANDRLMVQLFVNLINNAILHTPENTPIHIRIWTEQGRAYAQVADEGPGIPAADRKNLFRPFALSQSETADSSRSLGLGLSLCRTIMDVHGGKIELKESAAGACFEISLPGEVLEDEAENSDCGG